MRDVGNAAGICRYIVSLHAVSARECTEKDAVTVRQAYGGTVIFEFYTVCERPVKGFCDSIGKLFNLLHGVSVAKGEHRVFVRILPESGLKVRAYAAGRGVFSGKFRELGLQGLQFMHQSVIIIVTHCGRVLHIVLPAVLTENGFQILYPMFCLTIVHNCTKIAKKSGTVYISNNVNSYYLCMI